MEGNPIALLVMLSWVPLVLYLFSRYSAQVAMMMSFILAWMFLPQANIPIPGLPDYDRMAATCYGTLLATFIFDVNRFSTYRFSWIDIPILAWCICPMASSITNDLGPYDGFSSCLDQTMEWGVPYFLGRLYLSDFKALRNMAIALFISVIAYSPLCLIESRLSFNMHLLLYGFQHPSQSFVFSVRYGGYRPSVFMESGLMLSVWMMLGTLMGMVLWRAKILKKFWIFPMTGWIVYLLATFILIRSTGAYVLLVLGLLILFSAKWFRTNIVTLVLIAVMGVYLHLGATGQFPRQPLVAQLSQVFDADRIQSLDFRFMNEEVLSEKARQRMLFGWGGFGRNRIFNEYGEDTSITDSLWIIVFGVRGVFGLVAIFTALLLPTLAFAIRYPAHLWAHPIIAPAAGLSASVVLYTIDCVLNAMINPMFMVIAGGIATVAVSDRPLGELFRGTPLT
jgi:hypothetical protein